MKLYCTTGEGSNGIKGKWTGTQADAKKAERAMREDGLCFVDTTPVEVPTHKAGLIEFLNTHGVVVEENGKDG